MKRMRFEAVRRAGLGRLQGLGDDLPSEHAADPAGLGPPKKAAVILRPLDSEQADETVGQGLGRAFGGAVRHRTGLTALIRCGQPAPNSLR